MYSNESLLILLCAYALRSYGSSCQLENSKLKTLCKNSILLYGNKQVQKPVFQNT